jgi:type IV pilus assembly protein PilV
MRTKPQQGVMLLEALIAILIFSIGILGLVAMQGNAINNISDAKYRTDASFLADQLIAQIWVDRANMGGYDYRSGGTPPTALASWVANVNATLPQAAANPPIVAVDVPSGSIDITVQWQQPNAGAGATPRRYRTVTVISSP